MSDAIDADGSTGDASEEERPRAVDDTTAFQAFYLADPEATAPPRRSLFHRLFVGWWRDKGA